MFDLSTGAWSVSRGRQMDHPPLALIPKKTLGSHAVKCRRERGGASSFHIWIMDIEKGASANERVNLEDRFESQSLTFATNKCDRNGEWDDDRLV